MVQQTINQRKNLAMSFVGAGIRIQKSKIRFGAQERHCPIGLKI